MQKALNLLFAISFLILFSCSDQSKNSAGFPILKGPYLSQTLPDSLPEIFAPGIVGTGMFTRDIAMSPAGDEIYYCVAIANYTYASILFTKLEDGKWTRPEIVPFASDAKIFDFEPAFSPDGNRLYFLSTRPDGEEAAGDQDIWYVDRTADGWGEPVNPGAPLNTDGGEFFPSLTNDGYIYFTHNDAGAALNQIFRSKIVDGAFQDPELLPEQVNCGQNQFNAFVSSDHTYAIVPAMGVDGAFDQVDYFITFRNDDDQWSEPQNMGSLINKDNTRGWSPYVSPDGKYFFFMANWSIDIPAPEWDYDALQDLYSQSKNGNSDIYWMRADFIENLRKSAEF